MSAKFYRKFYSDNDERTFVIVLTRAGWEVGVTGLPFTDPAKLEAFCGIKHDLNGKAELSAKFIYKVFSNMVVRSCFKGSFILRPCLRWA